MRKIIAVLTGVFVAAMFCATIGAQTKSVKEGVYTDAQAKRGEAIAGKRCATCHNADLAGGQDGPGLVGADVLQAWSGTTAADLFDKIKTTMPADAPQSLSPQETADLGARDVAGFDVAATAQHVVLQVTLQL